MRWTRDTTHAVIYAHINVCTHPCASLLPHCETGGGDLPEEYSESEVYAPVRYLTTEQLEVKRLHALRCDRLPLDFPCMLARTLPLDFLPTLLPQC